MVKFIIILSVLTSLSLQQNLLAQDQVKNYLKLNWNDVATRMSAEWYGSDEAKIVADSVLKYQTQIGGWPKNSGFHNGSVKQDEWARIQSTGIGATFDNGSTIREMKFLVNVYTKTKDGRYLKAFEKGLQYIFEAQYDNGGWPQFFPPRKNKAAYSSHITYNDDAIINVMNVLHDIVNKDPFYASMHISDENTAKAKLAFNKGIDCIIKTQIVVNGKPTIWCAQHDEFTLAPAQGRVYEYPSFSGFESANIIEFLMGIDKPSKEIINSVNGAVEWFEKNKIHGIRYIRTRDEAGKKTTTIVPDANAPAVWARFYELDTAKPFFSDKTGKISYTFDDIDSGYEWYSYKPQTILDKYPIWNKKWNN